MKRLPLYTAFILCWSVFIIISPILFIIKILGGTSPFLYTYRAIKTVLNNYPCHV